MPSKGYNCKLQRYISEDEQKQFIKEDVNIRNKIRYWKKTLPFKLTRDDYLDFIKISKHGKKIAEILDFLKNHKVGRLPKTDEELAFYAKYLKTIKFAEDHLHYIKTLELKELLD